MVIGQNYVFVQYNWLIFVGLFYFRVVWYVIGCCSGLVNVGVYQMEFQCCCCIQNFFCMCSVLNIWQFNNDMVSILMLNYWFCYVKLVYMVMQDINVLLYCIFMCFTQMSIVYYCMQLVVVLVVNYQVWMVFVQICNGFIMSFSIVESDVQVVVVFFMNSGIWDVFFVQVTVQVIDILFLEFVKCGVYIYFYQEVNVVMQVKVEFYWFSVNSCQLVWCCWGKVKCYDVFVIYNVY